MKVIYEKTVKIEINYNLKLIKHQCLKLNFGLLRGLKTLFSQGNCAILKFLSLDRHLKSLIHLLMGLIFELSSIGTRQRHSLLADK